MPGVANVGNRGGRWKRALLWVAAGSWLPALPKGCTSPALCRQHRPRQQIPFEEAGFHSAISPGLTEASHKAYKKKKGNNQKEKAPKPMMIVIYRSWQCVTPATASLGSLSLLDVTAPPHMWSIIHSLLSSTRLTLLQLPYPSMAQTFFFFNGVLTHCFLSTNPESVI